MRHARPRVVVLASAPASPRARILLAALSAAPRLGILIVAPGRPSSAVLDALAQGARGHLDPARVHRWLARAVRAIARGEAWCSRALAAAVVARVARDAAARRAVPTDLAPWSNGRRAPRRRR
jgi:DNA-binding NarL/FixJ family response regulator